MTIPTIISAIGIVICIAMAYLIGYIFGFVDGFKSYLHRRDNRNRSGRIARKPAGRMPNNPEKAVKNTL